MRTKSAPRLETAIRAVFAPALRRDEFQGSGRKFYRLSGPWIEIVTIQGSRYGGSFAVNLGIQFAAAPNMAGITPDPKKMIEADCEFRRRLSEAKADMWWKHGSDETSMLEAIQAASETYGRFGRGYFERAEVALQTVTPEALASGDFDFHGFGTTKVRLGLALARIRKLEGRLQECRGFAEYGLRHIGVAASLKPELELLAAT